ncbi:MAG: T9SS type A sorting domain-containing protein [Paludibacteraceae bacterium]|nr:T9SS type A sorting domain-containing protein [Paludibacteraceae bacterium]
MKNTFVFLMLLGCMTHSYAITTTITTSLYIDSTMSANYSNAQPTTIPNTPKKVHFRNHISSMPEIETALTAAEYIFSKAMADANLDLTPIIAEVAFADPSEIDFMEACKVEVKYTDYTPGNSYYPVFSYSNYDYPYILYPQTVINQCSGNSDSVVMCVKLNPSVNFHCDISSVPENKYDAISILLRALAIGCGIQSSFQYNNLYFGQQTNGNTYITLFDTHIYNDDGAHFEDVTTGALSAYNFLANHSIFITGERNNDDNIPIQLYNDWEITQSDVIVSSNTLNTIDPICYYDLEDENFIDLMDVFFSIGREIREVTPYTMAILKALGWKYSIPVGNVPDDYVLHASKLQCSGFVLSPNIIYSLNMTNNVPWGNITCQLFSLDSTYLIGEVNNHNFSYSEIPSGIQWKRNPCTKNIIGQIQANVYDIDRGTSIKKTCDIEIPFRPNTPIVTREECTNENNIQLNLKAFANGSESYTITYTGTIQNDSYTITIGSNQLDTVISVPATQLYNMSIIGTNYMGNSDSYNFTFGYSAQPPLNMAVYASGNILIYDLSSNGTVDISNVVITSVQVTDRFGNLVLTSNAQSGEFINISTLTRGYYILSVIADGHNYSRMFIKR